MHRFVTLFLSMEHMGMSTNGIKLSINNATKNSLKRRVYVCQPWPGPLGSDPRYVETTSALFSLFVCLLSLCYMLARSPADTLVIAIGFATTDSERLICSGTPQHHLARCVLTTSRGGSRGGRACVKHEGMGVATHLLSFALFAHLRRLDAERILLLWLKVRGGRPGPIFCRPLLRKAKGKDTTVWDTNQKIGCEALTTLAREALADCGMLDVSKVATHSGKRTGVQLYDALGMTDAWVMDKGGWDSASAFVNYKALCNRLEMRHPFCKPQAWSSV